MRWTIEQAENLEARIQELIPGCKTRIDSTTHQVSALAPIIEPDKQLISQLVDLVHQRRTIFFKRSGNKVGLYIS